MSSDESTEGTDRSKPTTLLATWPTDLREEWRRRTRFGKLQYAMNLPIYIIGWAVILALAGIMAAGYYGLVGVWRGARVLSRLSPDKYRGDSDGE